MPTLRASAATAVSVLALLAASACSGDDDPGGTAATGYMPEADAAAPTSTPTGTRDCLDGRLAASSRPGPPRPTSVSTYVRLRNTGPTPCTLTGVPDVRLAGPAGALSQPSRTKKGPRTGAAVRLAPGAGTWFRVTSPTTEMLQRRSACNPGPVGYLLVRLPDSQRLVTARYESEVPRSGCRNYGTLPIGLLRSAEPGTVLQPRQRMPPA